MNEQQLWRWVSVQSTGWNVTREICQLKIYKYPTKWSSQWTASPTACKQRAGFGDLCAHLKKSLYILHYIDRHNECYCLSYTLPFPSKWCTKTSQFSFNYQSFPFAIFCLLKASFSFTISSWSCLLPHLPLQAPPHSLLFHPLSLPRFSSTEIASQLHPFWPISCRWSISSHAWKSGAPWLLGQSPPIIFYDFSNHFSSPSFCLGPPVQFF